VDPSSQWAKGKVVEFSDLLALENLTAGWDADSPF
jgi:hypothetical protein